MKRVAACHHTLKKKKEKRKKLALSLPAVKRNRMTKMMYWKCSGGFISHKKVRWTLMYLFHPTKPTPPPPPTHMDSDPMITDAYCNCIGYPSGSTPVDKPVLRILCDPWIRNPGWVTNQDPGSGMNNAGHISESIEQMFWVTNI
jgi:hypothetical protein